MFNFLLAIDSQSGGAPEIVPTWYLVVPFLHMDQYAKNNQRYSQQQKANTDKDFFAGERPVRHFILSVEQEFTCIIFFII